ncbi:MAG TPA: YceI family protein [Chitinophagales bacterium]|jgi:polyisoprenoid-binding protein YceI|nr:YceI family protein [Chitinophagales bacterium]HQV78901.1 YceI family protein [Chitinophagales bacterium]HQW79267.1 YceI family protein [Chitinophagales bacterium]HRB19660.1 YceI family protein [Chitinophagales bacterium]HRB67240.1 YceI family protein [Chitinophagales bacterium]
MRTQILTGTLALFFLCACNTIPKGDNANTSESQSIAEATELVYNVDSTSSIEFTGNGVGKNHPGLFKISDGKISVHEGSVHAGSFIINIPSMILKEEGEMIQTKLKGHLLSPDFFDVQKYPTAKFEITKVTSYTSNGTDKSVVEGANALVSGNLTLKDAIKNVTFPANITISETEITVKANFNIDRTQWNMSYGNDKSLKDKFISPEVNIALDVKAKR